MNGTPLILSFIGGFYHAGGSIYRRYSKQFKRHARVYRNLLVIQFRTKLGTLIQQLHDAINHIPVSTTRLAEKDGVFTFRTTNQNEIKKFQSLVRPRYKTAPRTL